MNVVLFSSSLSLISHPCCKSAAAAEVMAEVCTSHAKPSYSQEESSDCATLSSTPNMEANDDVSTASESELDSMQDSDVDDSEDDDRYSKKRHRRTPPPIFFGTPNRAEHEVYVTQARSRRLQRRDSLELTRRKSGGMDRSSRQEGPYPTLNALQAAEDDISAFVLSDALCEPTIDIEERIEAKGMIAENGGDIRTDSDAEEEPTSEENSSDDESNFGGDRTIQLPTASLQVYEQDPPSTPTKQILRPYLSRPSLAISEADSSPGIALAQHLSSAGRPSPFSRPSPASGSRSQTHRSPLASIASPLNQLPEFKAAKELVFDDKELSRSDSVSSKKNVLKESPSRINRAVSPSKPTQSSPTKVVVRQTLSAWAHAKLKTPQSPEKKEWDQKHAVLASPTRVPLEPSSVIDKKEMPAVSLMNTAAQIDQQVGASASRTEHQSKGKENLGKTQQSNGPSSRIARPVLASRLPRPVQRLPSANTSSGTAPKRVVVKDAAPTYGRIIEGSSSSNNLSNLKALSQAMVSRPTPRSAPFSQSSVPFRPHPTTSSRPLGHKSAFRSSSSSPIKTNLMQQRSTQVSSPIKRAASSSTTIVRDARLIAAPRRLPQEPSERPSSALSSSSSHAIAPSPLPSATRAFSGNGTPVQMSAGVGGARRVAISREIAAPIAELPRVKVLHKVERLHSDESRGIRIKEIMMGRSPAPEKTHSSDGSDAPLSNLSAGGVESVIPLLQKSKEHESKMKPLDAPRSSKRQHGKQSSLRAGKPARSPSVFSSSLSGQMAGEMSLSKTELSRLTSLHTQRNEQFISQLETIVIRKKGELRPCSPSSKIRKSIADDSLGNKKGKADKEARKQRARKRTPDAFEEDLESSITDDQKHPLGAGEDSIFISPPKSSKRRVRWHRSLLCGPNNASLSLEVKSAPIAKGCLRDQSVKLDYLGNVLEANQPWSPRLTRNKVTIYKLIYDDDEQ